MLPSEKLVYCFIAPDR